MMTGDYEILEAVVVSAGDNLPCFDYRRVTYNKTRSRDNNSGRDNLINVDLGYVPNLAAIDSEVEIEENKVKFLHKALLFERTLHTLDVGCFCLSLYVCS